MSKVTIEKMIMEEAKDLPKEKLNEILDFILFLKSKKAGKKFQEEINDELGFMNKISLGHLEEEFSNYKEEYPHEQ